LGEALLHEQAGCSRLGQVQVLIASLLFIGFVTFLHIVARLLWLISGTTGKK
jgi:hypothetical protein